MAKREKGIHANHRSRVKKRFLSNGLDSFEDHNVLELLLFFALPKIDVNPLAHLLMERYGSLSAVFDAPFEDLCKVPGAGPHTACLIKLLPQMSRRYCADRFSGSKHLPEHDTVGNYLTSRFLGENEEVVIGMLYDASLQLLDVRVLHRGSLSGIFFSLRNIVEPVLLRRASYVILAHNHPKGLPIASDADLDATRRVKELLAQVEVTLIEHFIIAEDRYTGLMPDVFNQVREKLLSKTKEN